jgi:hypothetical protein
MSLEVAEVSSVAIYWKTLTIPPNSEPTAMTDAERQRHRDKKQDHSLGFICH